VYVCLCRMSAKGTKRITSGDKNTKAESGNESKVMRQTAASAGTATAGTAEDDYEKGKKPRGNSNRDELDADRKAVEELEKWNY
jgi:hypothetical protein